MILETSSEIANCIFNDHNIRIYGTGKLPLFMSSDIENLHELTHVECLVNKLDSSERFEIKIINPLGIEQLATVITLASLCTILRKVNTDTTNRFMKWITEEVIPPIRKRELREIVSYAKTRHYHETTSEFSSGAVVFKPLIRKTPKYTLRITQDTPQGTLDIHPRFPRVDYIKRAIANHRPITQDRGYVYLITEHPFSNFVKIGFAVNPQQRVRELQTGNPHKLVVMHTANYIDYQSIETLLHEICNEFRVQGEWFKVTTDELNILISAM